MGKVQFGGIVKDICLAYTPEARVGDFVIVHVGFAISRVDEAEAKEIFTYLEEIAESSEHADAALSLRERARVRGNREIVHSVCGALTRPSPGEGTAASRPRTG